MFDQLHYLPIIKSSDDPLTIFMNKPFWMYSYKINRKSLFHHCLVNYFLSFPASYHSVCFKSFSVALFSCQASLGNICWVKKSFLVLMIKFFHQAFILWRTAWGRQWIVIWHANIQNKEKKTSFSFKLTHISQKWAIYSNVYLYPCKKKKERNSKNKNKNKQFLDSDLHDFFSTNRLFGKTDKHLTKCLTSLPVCLFCLL